MSVTPERDADTAEKLPPDRITHGAWANDRMQAVLHHFGKKAFARSSACMEFEDFLRRIGANGKTCLEIGTYNGITAIVLSQYFEKVICVSVDDADLKPGIIKHEIVKYLGITNIEFHDCDDNKQKRRLISELDFDFAYSDGDHTHDARSDFNLVKRCGRVLMHEAWPIQASVWNLVHSLPAEEVTWALYDCFAFWERKSA